MSRRWAAVRAVEALLQVALETAVILAAMAARVPPVLPAPGEAGARLRLRRMAILEEMRAARRAALAAWRRMAGAVAGPGGMTTLLALVAVRPAALAAAADRQEVRAVQGLMAR